MRSTVSALRDVFLAMRGVFLEVRVGTVCGVCFWPRSSTVSTLRVGAMCGVFLRPRCSTVSAMRGVFCWLRPASVMRVLFLAMRRSVIRLAFTVFRRPRSSAVSAMRGAFLALRVGAMCGVFRWPRFAVSVMRGVFLALRSNSRRFLALRSGTMCGVSRWPCSSTVSALRGGLLALRCGAMCGVFLRLRASAVSVMRGALNALRSSSEADGFLTLRIGSVALRCGPVLARLRRPGSVRGARPSRRLTVGCHRHASHRSVARMLSASAFLPGALGPTHDGQPCSHAHFSRSVLVPSSSVARSSNSRDASPTPPGTWS